MIFRAVNLAFSTYSHIPMPVMKDREKIEQAMPYAICFFPLVGAVLGGLFLLWLYLAGIFGIPKIVTAVGSTILPILVTGGIHLDGFCDVTDAFSSWQTKERRLEILKDPHVGAFAVIGCACYLLAYFGIMSVVGFQTLGPVLAVTFMMSRALSALALLYFKNARPGGMLYAFSSSARKKIVTLTSVFYLVAGVILMCLADWRLAIVSVLAQAGSFLYYRVLAYKRLGGTTGDMAGWFVQVCELAVPVAVCVVWGLIQRA